MITALCIAVFCIDRRRFFFLPCPMLPVLVGAFAFIIMVKEGLQ